LREEEGAISPIDREGEGRGRRASLRKRNGGGKKKPPPIPRQVFKTREGKRGRMKKKKLFDLGGEKKIIVL